MVAKCPRLAKTAKPAMKENTELENATTLFKGQKGRQREFLDVVKIFCRFVQLKIYNYSRPMLQLREISPCIRESIVITLAMRCICSHDSKSNSDTEEYLGYCLRPNLWNFVKNRKKQFSNASTSMNVYECG